VSQALWDAMLDSDPVGASWGPGVRRAPTVANAGWEKNHLLLFQASLDWLTKGSVNGVEQGVVRLGY